MNYEEIYNDINTYEGELSGRNASRYEYVISGDFEKDYFEEWINGLSNYPYLAEIKSFCECADAAILDWIRNYEDKE